MYSRHMPLTVTLLWDIMSKNNSEEVGTSHPLPRRQDGTWVFKLCNSPMVWDYIHSALGGETADQNTQKLKVWVDHSAPLGDVKVHKSEKQEGK